MKRTALLGSCLAFVLGTAACQDQPTAPAATAVTTGEAAITLPDGETVRLDRGQLRLPASGRVTDQQFQEMARRAIDPGDYECPASTDVVDWYLAAAYDIIDNEPAIFNLLYNQLLADLIPTYEALYFQTTDTPQYFGYNGEYNEVMRRTERDIKRFWDIPSDDIQVIGMHGTMLQDVDRVSMTYEVAFGLDAATADFFAGLIRNAVLASQTIDGGNHPLFSFNAFAFTTFGGPLPDKIIMGDGILAGYEALGFGDVAPQGVFAHEFAHHIQYENDYFTDSYATTGSEAEQTRYTELMADAMSAYYLTHKRGLALNKHRVAEFLEVFYQIGDCAFSNPGHHGTPNQRMAAAEWGFDLADQARKQGHILSSEEVHTLFVAAYPGFIAPDAP